MEGRGGDCGVGCMLILNSIYSDVVVLECFDIIGGRLYVSAE
jgi:hypothetical protein